MKSSRAKQVAHAFAFPPRHDRIALVLQGGGALGAFQAGVYSEIFKTRFQPNWVAGVSIGAVNAALIAGNPPERRIDRLNEFWDLVSSGSLGLAPEGLVPRTMFNRGSALLAATMGVPGFYRPRFPPVAFQPEGTEGALSIYDAAPLEKTLERLVDFDLLNSGRVRLSVGAVNVRTGNSEWFDNATMRIGPRHIMASGALPPGFAPVRIGEEAYWDGGIVSNTPLQYVLDKRATERLLIFQVDLFSARGSMPKDLGEAMQRQKDITYSSRTRFTTDRAKELNNSLRDVFNLLRELPPKFRDDPRVKMLEAATASSPVDIVHLIYRNKRYELDSKDYEFSRASVRDHWLAGQRDMAATLAHPEDLKRSGMEDGITVYDLKVSP
jgi:NTE family protein